MPNNNWSQFWSLLFVLMAMLALNYYANWWLLPDLMLLMLLQSLLDEKEGYVWRFVLPMSILLDFSAQTLLGFHGAVYAMMAIVIAPLVNFWPRASLLEQSILVALISVGAVVLRALALFFITDIPAAVGWYWPIFTQILCWPLLYAFREILYRKTAYKK